MRRTLLTVMTALLLSLGPAWSGPYEDSVAAYRSGDYATALQIFRSLAAQGDARAQTDLGMMFEWGSGITQDYAEAIKWFRLAAAQGDALAQRNLGFMYERGEGVTQDYVEAVKWFRLAAAQGDASAQNNLGAMYVQGHGVTQDYAEAAKWFRSAAAQGFVYAQYSLGQMYLEGRGVTKNLNEAQRLLDLAAGQNVEELSNNLVKLQRQLTQAQAGEPMSVEDFILDMKRLDNRVVAVRGVAMCMGADLCFLHASLAHANQSATFDPTGLPREDRRKLLDCNVILNNCSLTVIGHVRSGAMIAPLVARQIEW